MRVTKRYQAIQDVIPKGKILESNEAITCLKELSSKCSFGFVESVDMSVRLNLKAKHSIRDTIILPHSMGQKQKKILVFAKTEKQQNEARESGADFIGSSDYIVRILKESWLDFDVAIATPDMMKDLAKLGPVLGRKGLMPNPKSGTVTMDIQNAVKEFRRGKVEFRSDRSGIVSMKIGVISLSQEQLLENIRALYHELLRKKPSDLKGEYVKTVHISSTMGPGIRLQHQNLG